MTSTGDRTLGPFTVGPLALGCWRFVPANVTDPVGLVSRALDLGMNLVDNADVYGLDWGGTEFGQAEWLLGEALAAEPSLRDRMVLATKGGIRPPVPYDSSDAWIREAVTDSLRRLRVETIDLYQIHRPDPMTHPAALAETLSALREAGHIREVGVSNHTVAQTRALQAHLDFPLISNQPEYSVLHLDPWTDGTFDHCCETGMRPLVWSPLAGGRVVGDDLRPELAECLDGLAATHGVDRAAIALAFAISHPSAPVAIVGSTKPERLTSSQAALGVSLDRSDVFDIVQASRGEALP